MHWLIGAILYSTVGFVPKTWPHLIQDKRKIMLGDMFIISTRIKYWKKNGKDRFYSFLHKHDIHGVLPVSMDGGVDTIPNAMTVGAPITSTTPCLILCESGQSLSIGS